MIISHIRNMMLLPNYKFKFTATFIEHTLTSVIAFKTSLIHIQRMKNIKMHTPRGYSLPKFYHSIQIANAFAPHFLGIFFAFAPHLLSFDRNSF